MRRIQDWTSVVSDSRKGLRRGPVQIVIHRLLSECKIRVFKGSYAVDSDSQAIEFKNELETAGG